MAYENYNFVSWSDGTPISSVRLSQMSTNIEQVKDVVDDKASGVIKFNQLTTQVPNATGYSTFVENEVIFLKDETGTGGQDRRVSISGNRHYKITVNIPAIGVLRPGAEDSTYAINLYNGLNLADTSKVKLASWEVTPHTFSFINVAAVALANISNEAIKSNTYPSKIGAGIYTVLKTTGTALTNQSFFLAVARVIGANSNNAGNWRIEGSATAPIQIYVEDAGGV
jgi:hypothetical protein